MKVWTNNKFHGHWPVGTAAVVVAETPEQAAEMLREELRGRGLIVQVLPEQFEPLDTDAPAARVLCDGDY